MAQKIAKINAENKSGAKVLHEMFMAIFQGDNDWAECETESGMVSLIVGMFHYHLFAGTPQDGYKIETFKVDYRTMERIGKRLESYI